jgi:hypothetical protein
MRRLQLLLVAAVLPVSLPAQQWRTLDVSRQLHDSSDQRVHIQYGAGRLDVRPTSEPVLYTMHLRYDEDHGRPVHRYNTDGRSLTVGLTDQSVHLARHMDQDSFGELRLGLSRSVPIDLDLDVGAASSNIDLGGLSIRDLKLSTGASSSTLRFSSMNPVQLRGVDVNAGAASVELLDLGNANTPSVRVNGGVGSVTLDFGGAWSQDMSVAAEMALGKITMRVPQEVGVRVETQRFLASFSHDGLYRRGNAYYSDNWDTAKYKLRIRVQSVFGAIDIDRRGPRIAGL